MIGRLFRTAGVLALVLIVLGAGWYLPTIFLLGSGFVAKTMCSAMFVSGFDRERAWSEQIMGRRNPLLGLFDVTIDEARRRVRSAPLGFGPMAREAVWREGLGCALTIGHDPDALQAVRVAMPEPAPQDVAWPEGEAAGPPLAPVQAVLDAAFAAAHPNDRTHAIVVVHRGAVIAERYGDGIGPATPLPGWSMAKTVSNVLAGIAVARGRIALTTTALLPEWRAPDDPRAGISLGALLSMTSGLGFEESYLPGSDVTRMLFGVGDAARFVARFPLAEPVGSDWDYSSGSIVAALAALRQRIAPEDWPAFPRTALFDPIGMRTAVLETDPAGTFVGSSFVYASARDWARFALLILSGGVWNGQSLLPEGWTETMAEPVPLSSGVYGYGDVWIPASFSRGELPADSFMATGHDGQMIAWVPSRELAIIRLGMTNPQRLFDQTALVEAVLAALPAQTAAAPGDASGTAAQR